MTAIADLSELVNLRTGGGAAAPQTLWCYKDSRVAGAAAAATIAGRITSLWLYDGTLGTAVAPGAVAVPVNTTDGGFKQTDPGGGRQLWLASAGAVCSAPGVVIIYDRLLHISGLDATNTATQTVGGSLTRYTNGVGNQIWIEIYTQIGASSTTAVVNYTDQGGAASVTPTFAIGNTGFREAQRILIAPLAAGDTGVQGVTNVDLTATTGTAGNFGVTVAHPLAYIPVGSIGGCGVRDFILGVPGLPEVLTDACLAMAWVPVGTTAPQLMTTLELVER